MAIVPDRLPKKRPWLGWLGHVLMWATTAWLALLFIAQDLAPPAIIILLVAIATQTAFIAQKRRSAAQVRRLRSEVRLAIRRGPTERQFRSALEPNERVDFEAVKRAMAFCEAGNYELAIEVLDEHSADAVRFDYTALYVRGFAHLNVGARRQALQDFQQALDCLTSERGIVEAGMAALYITDREWEEAIKFAQRSIEHLDLTHRARRWVPYVYLAVVHEIREDVEAARKVLMKLVGQLPSDENDIMSFLHHHPFLQETMKSVDFPDTSSAGSPVRTSNG